MMEGERAAFLSLLRTRTELAIELQLMNCVVLIGEEGGVKRDWFHKKTIKM